MVQAARYIVVLSSVSENLRYHILNMSLNYRLEGTGCVCKSHLSIKTLLPQMILLAATVNHCRFGNDNPLSKSNV